MLAEKKRIAKFLFKAIQKKGYFMAFPQLLSHTAIQKKSAAHRQIQAG
jgi:hypothetical protein